MLSARPSFGWFLALALWGAAACHSPAPPEARSQVDSAQAAAEASSVRALAAFERAVNQHELEALAGVLTEDAVWYQQDLPVYRGRDAIQQSMAYDEATHTRIELRNVRWNGDSASCELYEENDLFRALGVGGIGYRMEIELAGGRIASLRSFPPPPDSEASAAMRGFLAWLRAEHSSEVDPATRGPGDASERARGWVRYAEEWVRLGRP